MNFDAQLFLFLNNLFNDRFASLFFGAVTGLGNGLVQGALITPIMFYFSRQKFKKHFVALVITAAAGGLLVSGVKQIVNRERPPAFFSHKHVVINTPFGEPHDPSFPSGHTETAFSTATYLSFLYPPFTPLFLAGAFLTAISRIAIGVHFPLDTLAGALIGIIFGFAGFKLNMRRVKRAKRPS
ncbi:MAG: phosphatase PAP2 family protein [Deltaproteobacteria bacterium]|nr:phosphatase PAP2 family protein [Deltaproteobacteria bacterium]